jgi:hypothetical protein
MGYSLWDWATEFRVTKVLKVRDAKLALFEKAAWLIVALLVIYQSTANDEHLEITLASGAVHEFSFERLKFNGDRNQSFGDLAYCSNSDYDYYVPDKDGKVYGNQSYWRDNNVACRQYMYADLLHVDGYGGGARLLTFEKFSAGVTKSCTADEARNWTCPKKSSKSTVLAGNGGADGNTFVLTEHNGNYINQTSYSCTCLEYRNFFSMGPEGLGVRFHHSFATPAGVVGGSRSKDYSSPYLRLKRKENFDEAVWSKEGQVLKEFNTNYEGKPIRMSVKEILDVAFAVEEGSDRSPLDERMTSEKAISLVDGALPPHRRLTGVTINFDFIYEIETTWDRIGLRERPVATLEISYTEGIVSWLPGVAIQEQIPINVESSQDRVYTELYQRGIVFNFNSYGKTRGYSIGFLFSLFVNLAVVLPIVTSVTIFAAKYLSEKRDIYKPALEQVLDYNREMCRFAAQIAVVAHTFKCWDVDGSGMLNLDEMIGVFSGIFKQPVGSADGRKAKSCELSKWFALEVFRKQGTDTIAFNHEISGRDLVSIIADDMCSIKSLESHANKTAVNKQAQKAEQDRARAASVADGITIAATMASAAGVTKAAIGAVETASRTSIYIAKGGATAAVSVAKDTASKMKSAMVGLATVAAISPTARQVSSKKVVAESEESERVAATRADSTSEELPAMTTDLISELISGLPGGPPKNHGDRKNSSVEEAEALKQRLQPEATSTKDFALRGNPSLQTRLEKMQQQLDKAVACVQVQDARIRLQEEQIKCLRVGRETSGGLTEAEVLKLIHAATQQATPTALFAARDTTSRPGTHAALAAESAQAKEGKRRQRTKRRKERQKRLGEVMTEQQAQQGQEEVTEMVFC